MTRRRNLLWLGGGLLAVLALAAVGPYVYWLGRGEHVFRLRPTSHWRNELVRWHDAMFAGPAAMKAWEPEATDRVLAWLRLGKPAVAPPLLEPDPAGVPVLMDLWRDEDLRVQSMARVGLMRKGGAGAQALAPFVNDPDPEVRSYAMSTLSLMRPAPPEAVETLCEALKKGTQIDRAQAAYCLGQMRDAAKSAFPLLLEAAKDPNVDVRFAALNALRTIDWDAAEAAKLPKQPEEAKP